MLEDRMTQTPEPPGAERPSNDPDQVTRRGAAGRRLVLLVAVVVLVVVLAVWLVIYLTASETSDESMGASGPAAVVATSAVQ
jgi:hypothetical protein